MLLCGDVRLSSPIGQPWHYPLTIALLCIDGYRYLKTQLMSLPRAKTVELVETLLPHRIMLDAPRSANAKQREGRVYYMLIVSSQSLPLELKMELTGGGRSVDQA